MILYLWRKQIDSTFAYAIGEPDMLGDELIGVRLRGVSYASVVDANNAGWFMVASISTVPVALGG